MDARRREHPEGRSRGDVYIVDDDPMIVAALEKILLAEGFRVESAADAEEAVRKELSFVPEVALMDVRMPKGSGIDLTRTLKESLGAQEIRIIVMTAYASPDVMERAKAAGADDFLTKPFHRKEVLTRLDR